MRFDLDLAYHSQDGMHDGMHAITMDADCVSQHVFCAVCCLHFWVSCCKVIFETGLGPVRKQHSVSVARQIRKSVRMHKHFLKPALAL